MRILGAVLIGLILMPGGFATAGSRGPNVLLITSEDNGPELGCYGDRYARTPNLDRLAAEGVRFERAFVATASCSESRAALLTGLYPHQNGQIGLATHHYHMFGKVPNAASRLKAAGYRTGLIGKLHVNPESAFPFDYRPNVSKCNSFSRRDVGRVAELAGDFFAADEGPFFLMVNYADAHLPFLRQQHGSPAKPLSGEDVRPLDMPEIVAVGRAVVYTAAD
jgi:N-sulfoglucosamine sulfohydrolase